MKLLELILFFGRIEAVMPSTPEVAPLLVKYNQYKENIRQAVFADEGLPNVEESDEVILPKAAEIELGPKARMARQELLFFLAKHDTALLSSISTPSGHAS